MFTREMLADVRCPKCPTESLELVAPEEEGASIVDGELHCAACGSEYQIRGGAADLVPWDALSDQWQLWKDHLAGFDSRRQWRDRHPDRFATKITNGSSALQASFAAFTEIDEGRILDVGCGPGNFRHRFADLPVAYWGIDPLPLPESRHFSFVRAVAEHLPFRDGLFTDVVVMAAMDHFQDVEAFCDETVRVLAPGGRLHIVQSVHDVRGPVTALKAAAHWVKDCMETGVATAGENEPPKHMTEFGRDSLQRAIDLRFEITRESKFSKRWYSPDNLFLTMVPRSC